MLEHFQDRSQLYAAIVRDTTDRIDDVVKIVTTSLTEVRNEEDALATLAGKLLTTLVEPEVLRLRRRLAERGGLQIEDPLPAANHFVGLLLSIPINLTIFGNDARTPSMRASH